MTRIDRIFGAVIAVLLAANIVAAVAGDARAGTPSGRAIAVLGLAALAVAFLAGTVMLLRRNGWIGWLALRVIVIALIVAALVAYPLWFIAGHKVFEIELRQALIAAAIVAAGWLVTFLVQEYRRESDRQERRADVRRTIRTEIELHYLDVHDTDWADLGRRLSREFFKDARFVPFFPRRDRDRFISTALARIELLSEQQIVKVMRYYELAERLERMNEDMRSDQYRKMQPARREAMALRLVELEETCMNYALEAIESLSASAYFQELTAKYPAEPVSKTGPATSCPEEEA